MSTSELRQDSQIRIEENVDITDLTALKIKGRARYYLKAKSLAQVKLGFEFAQKQKIPFSILGKATKVLFQTETYPGLIIHNFIKYIEVVPGQELLIVGSGVGLPQLSRWCREKCLGGFEWMEGIPGTVGGAVFMNAGAFGSSTADILARVTVFQEKTGDLLVWERKDLSFAHRISPFQRGKDFILEAVFITHKETKEKITKQMAENKGERRKKQPLGLPTLGSTFKNVEQGGEIQSSGYCLDQAGCKNLQVGGAAVSGKHANFIVNTGGATSADVLQLMRIMQQKVKEKFGFDLEPEIQII